MMSGGRSPFGGAYGGTGLPQHSRLTMRAATIREFGDPDVLRVETVPRAAALPGQTLVRMTRAGVNFFDTERRSVGWSAARLPAVLGGEVAGIRMADGRRVVALTAGGVGGYAEYVTAPDEWTVPIPDAVGDAAAVAVLIQGLTAWHTLSSVARLRHGETVVVNAAAGGVGSLAIQLAKWHGAGRVIALASTDAKRAVALECGADVALDSSVAGLRRRVLRATGGAGVDVVLESVAGPILDELLGTLVSGGRLVAYGQASGAANTVSVDQLMDRSIGVLGFHLIPYLEDAAATRVVIARLLAAVASQQLRVVEGPAFPLTEAPAAHAAVASGATSGKVTLLPD
jgi:NADPH:quinone reductase